MNLVYVKHNGSLYHVRFFLDGNTAIEVQHDPTSQRLIPLSENETPLQVLFKAQELNRKQKEIGDTHHD